MKLIGSKTSPFVRRIRLLLGDAPYQFEIIDVFSTKDRLALEAKNPNAIIPVLIDGDKTIWDSRLIARHILETRNETLPSLEAEMYMDLVNNAGDTGVLLFQFKKFELDPDWSNPISKTRVKKIDNILQFLEKQPLPPWGTLQAYWLYPLLDWLDFRKVADVSKFPNLTAFKNEHSTKTQVQATDPRI